MLSNAKSTQERMQCDFCSERKGRNAMIEHHLKFRDDEALRSHLFSLYGNARENKIESVLNFFSFVHRFYGQEAYEKYAPLWMVYLEAHGIKVNDRGEIIMRYRGRNTRAAVSLGERENSGRGEE
jgi:hypothetical protein